MIETYKSYNIHDGTVVSGQFAAENRTQQLYSAINLIVFGTIV